MGFSSNVGVECGSASVLCTMNLYFHIVLFQMLFKPSSFFERQWTFGMSAFEIFILVSMNEADVSFELPSVEEAFGAVWKLAFELFDPFVLEHVAAQVRFPLERTSTSNHRALVQTLPCVHGLVLVQPPLARERGPTVRVRAVEEL